MPIIELSREMKQAGPGDEVTVVADDRAFPADVAAWCRKTSNELVRLEPEGAGFRALVRKAAP
jgi:TusA-related sulfurtransferase